MAEEKELKKDLKNDQKVQHDSSWSLKKNL